MVDAQGNRYGPYDIEIAGSESEALTEAAWFDLFGHISGVKSGGALTFNGLTATLAPIDARAHGSYLIRTAAWSDASPPTAAGGSPRRDMLVARRQRTSGSGPGATPGKTLPTVLRGTPAATPAEPTTYDPVNDEALWSWQVPGNGGTVVTDIRDLRGSIDPSGAAPIGFVSGSARDVHFPAPAPGDVCTVAGQLMDYTGSSWKYTASQPKWSQTINRSSGGAADSYSGAATLLGGTWSSAPAGDYMVHVTLLVQAAANLPAELLVAAGGSTLSGASERADVPADFVCDITRAYALNNFAGGDLAVSVTHSPGGTATIFNAGSKVVLEYLGRRS